MYHFLVSNRVSSQVLRILNKRNKVLQDVIWLGYSKWCGLSKSFGLTIGWNYPLTDITDSKKYEAPITTRDKLSSRLEWTEAKHYVPVTHLNVKQNLDLLLQSSECCVNSCRSSWRLAGSCYQADTESAGAMGVLLRQHAKLLSQGGDALCIQRLSLKARNPQK